MRRDDATPSHPHLSLAPGATQRAQGASITHLHHPSRITKTTPAPPMAPWPRWAAHRVPGGRRGRARRWAGRRRRRRRSAR
eukprot:scaffold37925_cov48-Phaeocystis_antarctica.AAC.1